MLSDRQSKNYDEATNVFSLQVDERTRSKRGACYETIAEAQRISSSSQNVEATKTSNGLGISAPVAHRKRKTTMGKLQGYASSCKNVIEIGLDGQSVPHECQRQKTRRRIQLKPTLRGNKNGDMDLKEVEIERINVAEFREAALLKKKGNKNGDMDLEEIGIERIDEAEFKSKRTLFTSNMRLSTRQGFSDGFSAARSLKNVYMSRNVSSADLYRCFSPEDAGDGSGQGHFVQKGNETDDMVCKKTETDNTSRIEFRTKIHSKSKIGTSTRQGINEDHFVAPLRRKTGGAIENIFSAGRCQSSPPEHAEWPDKSCSIIQKGNDNEDMEFEENAIEINEESDFVYQKTHLLSNMGPSTKGVQSEGYSAATSKKDVGTVGRRTLSADCCKSSCPQNTCHGSDSEDMVPELHIKKTSEAEFRSQKTHSDSMIGPSMVQELSENHSAANSRKNVYGAGEEKGCMSSKEIKIEGIDEAYSNNEISRFAPYATSSTGQGANEGYSAAKFQKNVDMVIEISSDNGSGSFSSEDASEDSDMGQTDESSSFAEKGNNDKDVDPKKNGIEKIDESEFRNYMAYVVPKVGSSIAQALNDGHIAATSWDNVKGMNKKISSEKNNGKRKKIEVSAYSRRKENDEDRNRNLDVDVENCSGEYISAYSSSQSNSDSVDAFPQDDEISSYGADYDLNIGIASRTRSRMGIVRKRLEVEIVPLNDSDSSHTDGRFYSSDDDGYEGDSSCNSDEVGLLCSYGKACKLQNNNEETNCNEHTLRRQEFSLRTRKLGNDLSSKQTNGGKAHRRCETNTENKEINRILHDDVNAAEGSKDWCNGKKGNLQVFTYSKQSFPEKDCNKVEEADGLQPKHQAQAGIRKQRKAAPPIPKILIIVVMIIFRKNLKPFQIFIVMLVDSVLERGPVLEMKETDHEAMQEPEAQTQSTLPTKFRFEDEVPKEVEKTEYQKEMEGLFAELDFNWALEELGSFVYPEADQENAKDRVEETQHARCIRGKHELVLQDDQGLICIYCRHLELGPRDILPEWVEKTCTESERKRYSETEQLLEFDGFHLQSSKDNFAEFNSSANGTVWSIKPGIRESMYEHQQEGFEFLWKNLAGSINLDELKSTDPGGVGGCIISHAPGTGKTRLTIVFLESYLKLFPNCRPVIITPASMLLTWEEEFRKWNVEFPFYNLNNLEFLGKENKNALRLLAGAKRGNKDAIRMVKIYSWNMGRSILGISYSLFEKLTGEKYIKEKTTEKRERVIIDGKTKALRKILLEKPGLVILDEGHTPRNRRSNIWNVLLKVQTKKRVILSGTPFQNNFGELFNNCI
ncbi:UNVERIFIED_CONTAM: SNF2 domain-containing protein CLASSY 3 [Sesamum calycinum]|uniref:SNF2 domain-containing protein CLASSY 3 n=1 Tax=Sesamum calycinum TaxID=2727403 RepID=A0AAW2SYF4_9LAMI